MVLCDIPSSSANVLLSSQCEKNNATTTIAAPIPIFTGIESRTIIPSFFFKNTKQDAQNGRPARPQRAKQAEVEAKVERRSDSFFLSLDLSLNLPEGWRAFSASC
jgi:hypothetical protein